MFKPRPSAKAGGSASSAANNRAFENGPAHNAGPFFYVRRQCPAALNFVLICHRRFARLSRHETLFPVPSRAYKALAIINRTGGLSLRVGRDALGKTSGAVARLFGPSNTEEFAALLLKLADVGVECAAHFRATDGQDLPGIVAFERRADKLVDQIHEILDNSFIMRFDIPDAMRLTDEIDDVIDGMRGAAAHIDIYKNFLATLRPEARELMVAGERSILALRNLIAMLKSPRLSLHAARDLARAINDAESDADKIIARAERGLVKEFSDPSSNTLEFIALERLYAMIEEMTDDAKRCGKLIVSLARKEA
jgi:uncharacterized protein Yka (UPF0111/DUF47 family)